MPENKIKDKSKKIKDWGARQKIKVKRQKLGRSPYFYLSPFIFYLKFITMQNDLCDRLFEFAVRTIDFLKTLPYTPENKTIRTQLSKSACSSGANYEESQAGSSKADFNNKVRISLREMRESNYWLRITKRTVKEVNGQELDFLVKESTELKNILGSIVQRSRE